MELLDGDKIAVLLAAFIANCLEETGLTLSLAVIQVRKSRSTRSSFISSPLWTPQVSRPTT